MIFGVGFWMAVVALVLYALLPVLRNTMVGIRQVDPALIDAGRGMGMSAAEVLRTIELPLAVPVMLAGIRVALILNVGVATLAAFTNAGGLGSVISSGIALDRMPVLIVGSALTMALALTVDWLAGLAERVLRPRGI
jgi:osmoprotectant transport system permease protein